MTPREVHLGVNVHYSVYSGSQSALLSPLSVFTHSYHSNRAVDDLTLQYPSNCFKVNGSEDGGQSQCV